MSQSNGGSGRIQPVRTNGDVLLTAPDGRPTSDFRRLVERNQNFGALQSALDWIQERRTAIEHAPFGDNRKCKLPAFVVV